MRWREILIAPILARPSSLSPQETVPHMRPTKPRTAGLLIALALAAAAPVAEAPAQSVTPSAQAACKRVVILGHRKCIARGQYCTHTRRANRDYHRYGYHCGKRDRNGRYHLVYY